MSEWVGAPGAVVRCIVELELNVSFAHVAPSLVRGWRLCCAGAHRGRAMLEKTRLPSESEVAKFSSVLRSIAATTASPTIAA